MFRVKLNVNKIDVILTSGMDLVLIYLEDSDKLFEVKCGYDTGVKWVKEYIGFTPNIINTRL